MGSFPERLCGEVKPNLRPIEEKALGFACGGAFWIHALGRGICLLGYYQQV